MKVITLNIEQKKAASFTHGTAAVVAVPGAGKTLTMTHRIANLVKNHGVAPETIRALFAFYDAHKAALVPHPA